ncbi:MAG: hypothetical protein K2N94_16145, partial [Lachnospiraceae bacterium]|nr:hypothetical protein [Lachnospiraceae bacterium]
MKEPKKHSYLKGIAKGGLGLLLCLLLCAEAFPASARAEDKKVQYLYAVYSGGTLAIGQEIERDKLEVTVVYEDGTAEEVFDYALSIDKVVKDGANVVHVIYRGKSCEITVWGKRAQSLYVQYIGGMVSVGNSVSRDEIRVSVVFTDGSYEEVTDY